VRYDPKDFKQRRPDGNGRWVWSLKGVRLVLYRLPELLRRANETVFICEGEKDVHALESLGLLATCNPLERESGGMSMRRWYADGVPSS
jgi:putative DNA primase/helicase